MKRLAILGFAILFSSHALWAQQRGKLPYRGFSGGMMVHTGYVWGGRSELVGIDGSRISSQRMNGMPTGIGGVARIHLGEHLRVGTEGYVTTLTYGRYASYTSIGWGGLLADWIWNRGRLAPFAGLTLGGGAVKNLTLTKETPLDFEEDAGTSYRKYGFVCVVPFVGVEYVATPRVRIALKADYMLNVSNRQADFVSGPRIYLGFSFYRVD